MSSHAIFICITLGGISVGAVPGQGSKQSAKSEREVVECEIAMVASISEDCIAGSAANVHIKIENRGSETITLRSRTKYRDYYLELIDSAGKAVPRTQFGKLVSPAPWGYEGSGTVSRLGAGKFIKQTINLGRVFDLSREGQYTAAITRYAAKGNKTIELRIDKLSFRVVDEAR